MAPDISATIIAPEGPLRSAIASALRGAGFDVDEADDSSSAAHRDGQVVIRLHTGSDALDGFASQVSHDLKTPLAVISGAADTLRRAGDRLQDTDRAQLLDAMHDQATRAAGMLDDLLKQARARP